MNKTFEKDIAFFFGLQDTSEVERLYVKALSAYESGESQQAVIGTLHRAYKEINNNSNLSFDTLSAAEIECSLIDAHARHESFEKISQIMISLYTLIYKSESIKDASMLRTFLYQYKNRKTELGTLNQKDMELLKDIARRSEELLTGCYTPKNYQK